MASRTSALTPPPTQSASPFSLNTRALVIALSVLLFVETIAFYTTTVSVLAFSVLASDGLFAACWTIGACCLGAMLLRRFRVEANPLLFIASAGGLGLGVFSLLGLGLGLLGALNRAIALAMPI